MISSIQTLYSGTATSSSNTHSTPVGTKWTKEAIIFFNITAASGTLDVEVKTYDSITEKWYLLATFDQKSSITSDVGYIQYGLGEKLAVDYTVSVAGSFTFEVTVNIKED